MTAGDPRWTAEEAIINQANQSSSDSLVVADWPLPDGSSEAKSFQRQESKPNTPVASKGCEVPTAHRTAHRAKHQTPPLSRQATRAASTLEINH